MERSTVVKYDQLRTILDGTHSPSRQTPGGLADRLAPLREQV
jgi:hypothetical protein